MGRSKAGSPKTRTLGAELRKVREGAGLTTRALGQRLGVGHAWVVRTETGERTISSEDAAAIATAVGVSGAERDRIVELAREADGPDWLRAGVPGVHQELVTLIEYERTASSISDIELTMIPGLLQVPDYARAVMSGLSPAEMEKRLAMRARRRDVLTARHAPSFEGIVLDTALTHPIVDVEVMSDQLRHLEQLAAMSNVEFRVVPSSPPRWSPAHEGRFIYFEFGTAPPIVHLEHLGSAAFLTSSTAIDTYARALGSIRRTALTAEKSLAFVKSCRQELEEAAR